MQSDKGSFRIDVILNFMHRFGEDQLYHIRDMLNQGNIQSFIAKATKDRQGKSIHPSQLSRFIANTYMPMYVVKPGIIDILKHINEARNARIEENAKTMEAAIIHLARSNHQQTPQNT